MPLEGHWARTHTPTRSLRQGERRLVWGALVVVAVAAVALAAVIVFAGGAPASAPGCVDATIASTTGGAQFHACGERARAFCTEAATETSRASAEAREACRRAGL